MHPLQTRDETPVDLGWYATCHCWDEAEGELPSAHHWNGRSWDLPPGAIRALPIVTWWNGKFDTYAAALAYATSEISG